MASGTGSGRSEASTIQVDTDDVSDAMPERKERTLGVGERRGRYVVIDELGRGGMGLVVRAYDPRLGREVALKLLRHRDGDETATLRLMREAQAMAKLSHPNVVSVFDVERDEEGVLLAMELVRGQSLHKWLKEKHSWREVLSAFCDAGRGLAAAHTAGIIHRDFKPANVLMGEDGRVRVTDFGLARQAGEATLDPDDTHISGANSAASIDEAPAVNTDALTEAGMVMGTIPYMAPEQTTGGGTDARTDQYALCVSLWLGLCGSRPFTGTLSEQAVAKSKGPPAWPRDVVVPRRLQEAIRRGLAANPENRWPELAPLLREFEAVLGRRVPVWLYAAGGLVLLGGGVAAGRLAPAQQDRCEGGADRFAEVWNSASRRAIGERILGLQPAYAATTWTRVEADLDAYASAWEAGYAEACQATHVRHEQSPDLLDRRMACLDRARASFRTTAEVLAETDEALLPKAVQLVGGIARPESCADTQRLMAALPPPTDPQVAKTVADLREEIEAVNALRRAGRIEAATTRADALVVGAGRVEYRPLHAEAHLARGRLRAEVDEQDGAIEDLEAAATLATELDHQEIAAWATASLGYVVGHRKNDIEAGMAWGKMGVALARRYHPGGRAEGYAEQNLGALLVGQGRFDEGEAHVLAALKIREAADGPDSPELAPMLNNLGTLRVSQGRFEEGYEVLLRTLRLRESSLGPDHPYVGIVLYNLTAVLLRLERLEEAEAMARRTIVNIEGNYGPDHPKTAVAHSNLGSVLTSRDKDEEAMALFEKAIEVYERSEGDHRRDQTISMSNIASIRDKMGDRAGAEKGYREVLAIREALPEHPSIVNTLLQLAEVRLEAGDQAEARSLTDRAVDVASRLLPQSHPKRQQAVELANRVGLK